jgi:glycosyltransferase involved in cell wall biosynthesis
MLRMLSLENTLLSRGDRFSAPSGRQACAVMGELYLLGRLDARDRLTVPVTALQHCALDAPLSPGPSDPSSSFPVISTGSFNAWFDSRTLFEGLVYAMERNRGISFTATGGSVPFAPEQYNLFSELIGASGLSPRFRLAGWVSREELEDIQQGAGAAVYTDVKCGESLLGARTRALDWISRGIPVVCTDGAEISATVRDRGMGVTVPQGDHEALGKAILSLASDPALVAGIRESQSRWCSGEGSMREVFRPLVDWCSNPARHPRGQLAGPTVGSVSGSAYRKAVLGDVYRTLGPWSALRFLVRSLGKKLDLRGD